ncbi:MAG: hypothetical protein KQH59_21760 [Desulfobulbaceae bacterium]|nr:hypothetical protein [Desulfobulbaceae bacterium]
MDPSGTAAVRQARLSGRACRTILEGCLFLLLAIASTWPLARHGLDHLPLGTEPAATVPLFNVWTVWWNSERAAAAYRDYWDAPIFYPAHGAFAFSEPQPLTVVAAPIIWLTGNRILAYNALLLLALWMNGWIACRVLRTMHLHPLPAIAGGAFVSLLPLIHSWLGVLQLVPVFGILLSIRALQLVGRRPTIARGVRLGLSLALTYLLCSYYGLFLIAALVVPGLWLVAPHLKSRRLWLSLGAGAFVFLFCCLPVLLGQAHALTATSRTLDHSYLASLSARPTDYLKPVWPSPVLPTPGETGDNNPGYRLNCGYLQMALAAIGIWATLRSSRRRWAGLLVGTGAVALLLSFGPTLKIGEIRPYLLLVEGVPGFAQARNVFRFALFAALGLQSLLIFGRWLRKHPPVRKACLIMATLLGLASAIEQLPPAQPLYQPPGSSTDSGWIEYLNTIPAVDEPVVCLPFAYKPDVASYERQALWMYWQTFHEHPLVNGYSGFFPLHFIDLKWPMAAFPTGDSVYRLHRLGVELVVVNRNSPQGVFVQSRYRDDQRLEHIFYDDSAAIDIYRLHPSAL